MSPSSYRSLRKIFLAVAVIAVAMLGAAPSATASAVRHSAVPAADPAPSIKTSNASVSREKYTGQSCTLFSACLYDRGYYFSLVGYGNYYLSYFEGDGHYSNNTSCLTNPGGTCTPLTMKFYDANGKRVKCVPYGKTFVLYNFDPVYRVDLVYAGC